MFEKKTSNDEQNFWISYADLMAGLLFVFILLLGAIVVKYVYIQTDLQTIRTDLQKQKEALNLSDEQLEKKKKVLLDIQTKLKNSKEKSLRLSFEVAKAKNEILQTQKQLQEAKKQNKDLNELLNQNEKKLNLSLDQIEKITSILKDKQNNIELLDKRVKQQRDQIANSIEQLSLNKQEIEKLKDLLLGYELKNKEIENQKTILEKQIENNTNSIRLKDEELALLEQKLLIQSKEHQKLVEEFDITKVKIKNLTGVRIKVIKKLKDKLANSIDIDPKSGAMRFSSNILFEKGQYLLKDEAKKELSSILKKYIHTLLLDENMRQYIDTITIEGYTDSQGSYLYNLELSQKRALEVMKFLYGLDFKNKKLLEQYISASGRSYANLIYENNVENKEASRRIEIKFRIKNEKAIQELENFLKR
jgi:chemotaxis protein MotB